MLDRRNFIKNTTAVSAYTLFLSQLIGCKTGQKLAIAADAPYNMKYLTKNVGYFTERGGTIGWMASKDGIVIIDTQFPEQSNNLLAEIAIIDGGKVDALINTHHHGDHTAGNIVYKELTDNIIAHTNSKKNQMASAAQRGTEDKQLYPNTLFDKDYKLSVGDEVITMKYYGAAHTDGDIITHFQKANVVHMGDLIFNRRFPYIDKSAGANIANWVSVLDKADKQYPTDAKFIFGHSDNGYEVIGTKEDIKAFKNYLEKLLVFGEQAVKAGKSLEELKANTIVIPGAEEWTGKGIERSLDAIFVELKAS